MCVVCDYFKARRQRWRCARCGAAICLEGDEARGQRRLAMVLAGELTTCLNMTCMPVIFYSLGRARATSIKRKSQNDEF